MAAVAEARRGRATSLLGVLMYWGPLAVWFASIFFYASDAASAGHSGRLVRAVVEWVFPGAPEWLVVALNIAARKVVHASAYGALALLAYRAFRAGRGGVWRAEWAYRAVALAGFYASVDELVQASQPGRSGSVFDVLLDLAGATVALSLLAWLRKR